MQTREYTEDEIAEWNRRHPIGSECILFRDFSGVDHTGDRTHTRSEAWRIGSGHALVCVAGRTGGQSIDRIMFVPAVATPPASTEDSVAGLQLIAHIPSC